MNTYERALALVNSDPELCLLVKKLLAPRFSVPSHKRPMTLTPKMKELYDFIRDYTAANDGVSPSYDEMRGHVGLASKSGIHRLINALEERGHIHRLRNHARAIVCIDQELVRGEIA